MGLLLEFNLTLYERVKIYILQAIGCLNMGVKHGDDKLKKIACLIKTGQK